MNKKLFLIIISIPGLLSLIPKLNQTYITLTAQNSEILFSYNNFLIFTLMQSSILIIGSIVLGSWATKKFHWHDNTLNAIEANDIYALQQATKTQLIASLRYSLPAALCFVITLYTLLFPVLDQSIIEQMNDFSITSFIMRIFYGGIVEEILLRWNILSILVLLNIKFFKQHIQTAWWIAIILSAVIFGCGHLPIYLTTSTTPTITTILFIIGTNSCAGIFFGWIFKKFGLISAMIAHILFHITWFFLYSISYIKLF